MIIESENKKDDDKNDSEPPNKCTVIIDAAGIIFPQDLNLLNKSRENLEKIIDNLHEFIDGKKPRTYRKKQKRLLKIGFTE